MNSEKVKEIKKALECWQESVMLSTDENYVSHKVYNREILDYINELESENETIKFNMQETEKASFNINQMNGNLVLENQQLKDRIAELEKENQSLKESIEYGNEVCKECQSDKDKGKKWKLKQFAEMLKEKLFDLGNVVTENDIDVTLKEFIGE